MIYSTYVYVTGLFTSFCWWIALGSNANIDIQMGAVLFGCLGTSLLVMMAIYETDMAIRRWFKKKA